MVHDVRNLLGLTTRNDVLGTHTEFLRELVHLQRGWFLRQAFLLTTLGSVPRTRAERISSQFRPTLPIFTCPLHIRQARHTNE